MIPRSVQSLIGELAADNTSGAVEIATRAAEVLALFAAEADVEDASSFLCQLVSTGKALIQAQPSMAPLFRLVNSVVASAERAPDVDSARRATSTTAQAFGAELRTRGERIARQALSLLASGSSVLTHSRSSTVMAALQFAIAHGRQLEVVCTESRPIHEGRAVAARLAQEGIETTLITDSAAAHLMSQVDLVIVGADSVSMEGVVNKMGTYPIALAARAEGVPFYALCGTEKFLPTDYPYFRIAAQDPQEVWPGHPEEVTVLNFYFDVTPLEYVSGMVTEWGILAGGELDEMLGRLKMHELLLDR
jgi:translation initiation factor eIF-2B subunit delta